MKKVFQFCLIIICTLIIESFISKAQAILYVPAATGVVKQVPLSVGINVMTDIGGTMQAPTPIAFGGAYNNVILALPHPADGAQALADCMAGKVPPQQGQAGMSASCTVNQTNAINNAVVARVKLALQSIPTNVLQANDIEIVQ